jgi:hypothetical protein
MATVDFATAAVGAAAGGKPPLVAERAMGQSVVVNGFNRASANGEGKTSMNEAKACPSAYGKITQIRAVGK